MAQVNLSTTGSCFGKDFRRVIAVTADGAVLKDPTLAAAKTGTLSTRTDNTTGTLTMAGGHGLSTSDRIDLYWTNANGTQGRRYGITAGTVSGNSVPLTNTGAGDNLPTQGTAVTVMKPQLESFAVTAADMVVRLVSCAAAATAVFRSSVPATVAAIAVNGSTTHYVWESSSGVSTPFGSNVVDVYLSHADSASAQQINAVALVN